LTLSDKEQRRVQVLEKEWGAAQAAKLLGKE